MDDNRSDNERNPAPLGSVLTALVTPFDERGQIDEQAFVSLMRHVCATGSDGVVVAGTTGEPATLSETEQLRLFALACAERPAGKRVIASTGSNSTAQACRMSRLAVETGADAVLSVAPYYNRPNRRGLVRHYTEIASAAERPVIVYNHPGRTGIALSNELLADLAQIEHIDYVKQADDDSLARVDGLGLYAGTDDGFARALDLGGCGGILVASHLAGPLIRRMADEPDRRAGIDARLRPLYRALTVTTNPIPVKAALNMLGHRVGGTRLPLVEADEKETAVVRAALVECGLLTS